MAGTIYLVTNNLNGKQYVGQTIVANNRYGHGVLVTKAYKKHGKKNFSYEKICSNIENKLTLDFMEMFWIKVFNSRIPNGYNIDHGGFGRNKVSVETKEKLSKSLTGRFVSDETKEKIRLGNKGKFVSTKTKEKLSELNKGKTVSEETKQKLSEAAKKQWARKRGEI